MKRMVTQKEIDLAIILNDKDMKTAQIAEVLQRSQAQVVRMVKTKSLKEYRAAQYRERYPVKSEKAAPKETASTPQLDAHNSTVSVLKAMEYQQQLTNKKLEQVIGLLEVLVEKRRGSFADRILGN